MTLNLLLSTLLLSCVLQFAPLSIAWAQAPKAEELQAAVFVDRAVLAYGEKRYDDALKELQEALSLDPQNVDALYYQGLVYIAQERPGDAQASLEKARAIRPADVDVAFQLGVFYFSQKEYEKAELLLRQVHQSEPSRPNIGYYLGFIEYRKKNYREALTLLKANAPSDDEFAQLAHFYASLAAGGLGLTSQARLELEQVLRLQPASPLVAPAQRFGEILQTAAEKECTSSPLTSPWQLACLRGELRFGVFYDTNVPVVPNGSSDITAATIRQGTGRQSSVGQLATVNLAYTWLKNVDWEGTASYRFFQTYNDHLTEFNTQSHTPTIGIVSHGPLQRLFGEMSHDAGLQVLFDSISLGNRRFTQRWIVNPYFTLVENQSADLSNLTTLQFRFQTKNFFDDSDVVRREVRDALNYMFGPQHYVLFQEGRHYIKLGYQFDYEQAEGENWTYTGHRLLTGGQYTLPWWDVRLRYDLDFHWRNHRYNHSLLPATAPGTIKRRDSEPLHQVSVSKDFATHFSQSAPFSSCNSQRDAECAFTVSLDYLFDNNRSNIAAFAYKRHVVTTSLTWRF